MLNKFKFIALVFLLLVTANNSFAGKAIKEEDAIELIHLIQTEKDFNDADNLLKNAENFSELKKSSELREAIKTKTDSLSVKTPIWAESLWGIIILAFISGLAALLTPCVFPLIPMTVTFFMKGSKKSEGIRNALIYGVSIVAIYTLLGVGVSALFGADTVNSWATGAVANIIFFIIFMIFAASFLGMFEITLPSWMVNKIDQQADKGGFTAPIFMAFTLVLVSFSCTGPIVGSVLVEAADGHFVKPVIAMLSFGLAIALPFTLFAIFPGWLSNLPKSGGWLNSVKVVLGFIEIALGLKFLSIADQTYHWGILDREVYLAIWIALSLLTALYLIGVFKTPHDSDMDSVSVPRLALSIVAFSFTFYMIPGMWGAPLKGLSGYLPPLTTQDYDINAIVRDNIVNLMSEVEHVSATDKKICTPKPKYSDKLHLPHGLKGYYDLDEALECAKEIGKPIFIDFTGHGCVNCRKMEEYVWVDPQVLKRLRNDFVMVALYCDDHKITLPKEEWFTSAFDGKIKKTLGQKNADYQITKFKSNSQPLYVILGLDGEKMLPATSYEDFNLDITKFIEFLDKGKAEFENKFKNQKKKK